MRHGQSVGRFCETANTPSGTDALQKMWMSIFSLSIFNRILLRELGKIDCAYRVYGNREIFRWKSVGTAHGICSVRYGRNHFIDTEDADRRDFLDPRRGTFPRLGVGNTAFLLSVCTG